MKRILSILILVLMATGVFLAASPSANHTTRAFAGEIGDVESGKTNR